MSRISPIHARINPTNTNLSKLVLNLVFSHKNTMRMGNSRGFVANRRVVSPLVWYSSSPHITTMVIKLNTSTNGSNDLIFNSDNSYAVPNIHISFSKSKYLEKLTNELVPFGRNLMQNCSHGKQQKRNSIGKHTGYIF